MTTIRKLISAWMLALVGSLLLPLMSVAAVSGTTYDAPPTITTASLNIAQRTVAVDTFEHGESGIWSMASGQARSLFGLSQILVAPGRGSLDIVEGGTYSASELRSAQHMADQGHAVTLRPPSGTRAAGGTSDLLIGGARYDVYTPTTTNPDRIISAIAKKNTQASGVVLDLSNTSVTAEQLGNIVKRVQGAGATNITDVVVIGGGG